MLLVPFWCMANEKVNAEIPENLGTPGNGAVLGITPHNKFLMRWIIVIL